MPSSVACHRAERFGLRRKACLICCTFSGVRTVCGYVHRGSHRSRFCELVDGRWAEHSQSLSMNLVPTFGIQEQKIVLLEASELYGSSKVNEVKTSLCAWQLVQNWELSILRLLKAV